MRTHGPTYFHVHLPAAKFCFALAPPLHTKLQRLTDLCKFSKHQHIYITNFHKGTAFRNRRNVAGALVASHH